jgi:choline dehydrogenase
MADFIIIGAGSAGCVLANRLSADPNVNVVLLEAGGPDTNPYIRAPGGHRNLMLSGKFDWGYHTVAQPECDGRTFYWPRGKVLGGSSSINGMVYMRGDPSDFDRWAQLGNRGWSYADVLPYFKRAEGYEGGEDVFHGGSGPLKTSKVKAFHPLSKAWIDAGIAAGYPYNDDFNTDKQEGFGPLYSTIHKGIRASSAWSYLRPVRNRPNLEVIVKAHAARIIIESDRAVGVEYIRDGRRELLRADREVILSGGAINSPHLLQLSGIGNPQHLRTAGIEVRHELKGVGENLQDHLAVAMRQLTTGTHSTLSHLNPARVGLSMLQYALFRSGAGAHSGFQAIACLKTRPDVVAPDIQIHFMTLLYSDHGREIIRQHGFQPLVNIQRPESTGFIRAVSADPLVHPAIDPRYLSASSDLVVLREGIKIVREVIAQKPLDRFRGAEHTPGAGAKSDAEVDAFVRQACVTQYHPTSTCKMGDDEMAVVDDRLRVRGLRGLRVADASVMPKIVSANTNAATIMIAEKASDYILSSG